MYLCEEVENSKCILCTQKTGVKCAYLKFLTYKHYLLLFLVDRRDQQWSILPAAGDGNHVLSGEPVHPDGRLHSYSTFYTNCISLEIMNKHKQNTWLLYFNKILVGYYISHLVSQLKQPFLLLPLRYEASQAF